MIREQVVGDRRRGHDVDERLAEHDPRAEHRHEDDGGGRQLLAEHRPAAEMEDRPQAGRRRHDRDDLVEGDRPGHATARRPARR